MIVNIKEVILKISQLLEQNSPLISYEIFPPNQHHDVSTIYKTINELKSMAPDFMSVTFGAGGSSHSKTVEIASRLRNEFEIEPLAHLTCIGATRPDVSSIIRDLKAGGIENILALRGDIPQELSTKKSDFNYAIDLISYIKDFGNFCIGASVYPEGHPETNDLLDLFHLKNKVDAGVDFLISQMFFDNETFYRFMDKAEKLQINIPTIAGIMPVTNAKQISRIISMCGATLSPKFKRILNRYGDDPASLKEAGTAFCIEQIIDLISWGIDGVHIYTMNRSETAKKIHENISSVRSTKSSNVRSI